VNAGSIVVERGQIDAFEKHLSGGRRFDPAKDMQQGALPGSRGTHDRQKFTFAHLDIDPAQGMYAQLALSSVVLSQAAGFENVHRQ
jgi:hypothetical protein